MAGADARIRMQQAGKTSRALKVRWLFGSLGAGALVLMPGLAQAQAVSRPVVQPLPDRSKANLNAALQRVARNPRDVDAVIEAGHASIAADDLSGAEGFFTQALNLSSGNVSAMLGMAAVYVRKQQPLRALGMFDQAQAAGASPAAMALDRGLAYDLVGDQASAQAAYRNAMGSNADAQLRSRLALSLAISGDRQAFELALAPLIEKQDFAAFRTRAFGLAILGASDDAVALTQSVMPGELSSRMAPYLRYMPRLTHAQQAAAANLGIFPRASDIGRDTADVATYQRNAAARRSPDGRLEPRGEPLGARANDNQGDQSDAARQQAAAPAPQPRSTRTPMNDPLARTLARRPRQTRAATPEPTEVAETEDSAAQTGTDPQATSAPLTQASPVGSEQPAARPPELPPVNTANAAPPTAQISAQGQPVVATVAEPVVQPVPASPPVRTASAEGAESQASDTVAQAVEAAMEAPAQASSSTPRPGFDLTRVDPGSSSAPDANTPGATVQTVQTTATAAPARLAEASEALASPMPEPTAETVVVPKPTPAPAPSSVADAFSDLTLPAATTPAAGTNAVDITSIKPPRESEATEAAKTAEKPAHPRRFWVQVATGKDRTALKFDWRRISRAAPDVLGDLSPHVTPWGQANRLLAGPFDSAGDARKALNAIAEKGVDGFTYTSPEGEEIEPLR